MNTLSGLLVAVIAAPDDDLLRLHYADQCERLGDDARAEFIRVQCKLARLSACAADGTSPRNIRLCNDGNWCERCGQHFALRTRERELLCAHGRWWRERAWPLNLEVFNDPDDIEYAFKIVYRRGFVSSIACTWADWLAHHEAILAACPLRRVNRARKCNGCSGNGGLGVNTATGHPVIRCLACRGTGTVDDWWGDGVVRLVGERPVDDGLDVFVNHAESDRWPGVWFELPQNDSRAGLMMGSMGSIDINVPVRGLLP